MTRNGRTLVRTAVATLAKARTHTVPVVDRGRVVGLLRLDEVNQLVVGRDPGGSVAGSE